MEENKQNPETKEEKVSEGAEVNTSSYSEMESKVSEAEGKAKAFKSESDNVGAIDKCLKEADNEVRAKKLEFFLKELNEKLHKEGKTEDITSFEELTLEQRADFEKYELPKEEMDRIYAKSRDEVKEITEKRYEKYDSFGKDLNDLYNELEQKRVEAENNLNSKDPKVVEKAQKDLEKIEELEGKIGPDHGKSPVRSALANTYVNHDKVRMKAVNGLETIFGAERVRNDSDFIKAVVPKSKQEEYKNKAQEQDAQEMNENTEPSKEERNGQPGNGQNAQKPKNGQQAPQQNAAAAPQQPGAQVGSVAAEPVYQDMTAHNLAVLGYNDDKGLNFNTSVSMLELFTADALTNKERMDMINDPGTREKLMKAMKTANDSLWPSKRKAFDYARNKLIDYAKGPLMKQALADMGVTDPKNIKKEFNDMYKAYENQKSDIEAKLQLANDDATKEKLNADLNELNAKYTSIVNAKDFSKAVGKVKTIKSTFREFKEALSKKSTYKALASGAIDKTKQAVGKVKEAFAEPEEEEPTVDAQNKEAQAKEAQTVNSRDEVNEPQNDFMAGLQSGVTDYENLSNDALNDRAEDKAETRTSRRQQREQSELEEFGKKHGKHSKEYLDKKAAMEKPEVENQGPEI